MADEATATAVPAAEPAPPAATVPPPAEAVQTNGEKDAEMKENEPAEAEKPTEAEHTNGDKKPESVKPAEEPAKSDDIKDEAADATPPGGKDKKRKSLGGVPEHKSKKLNKKKSMPTLHLACKPGEFYWARLKGYPPWPAVICDESMLPESLLASRPVSTARPDGSLRDDFKEGGKNAKERTFPIMFMSTNEFQWMVNTSLTPLDPEECKTLPQSKMTKALQNAYQIASENHDLQYFKDILKQFQEEQELLRREQAEALAEAERVAEEKAAKAERDAEEGATGPKKKKARKSKAADDDVEMEDADAPKSSKKRKSAADSDGETKPKKTPRVMKLNAPKTPNGEASGSKKSSAKPKKKVVTAPKVEEDDDSKPQMTEEEKLAAREKAILYLRHRLQKGFLSRDSTPQESEMPGMAEFFSQLENYTNLEPSIIRATKIHKVLKAIVKLASVPRDDEFHFKKRSSALLEVWNKSMEETPAASTSDDAAAKASAAEPAASEPPATEAAATTSNDAEPKEEAAPADEKPAEPVENPAESAEKPADEPVEKPTEKPAEPTTEVKEANDDAPADVDVSMHTAPEEATV